MKNIRYAAVGSAALVVLILGYAVALAHSGGLDSNGGHWDHKTGTYHYHRGPKAGGGSKSSSSSSTNISTSSSYSDNTVSSDLSGTPEVSISSSEREDEGRFTIRKTGPNQYALSYSSTQHAGSTTTYFTARAEDIEDFGRALADVIDADVD
jgi:hypothetical protein